MFSINGSLKFNPGVSIRRYLPNMVITTIVPCFTDTKEVDIITSTINTIIEKMIWLVMGDNI
jgi:hypothetical protein